MDKLVIRGGTPLLGTVRISGAKNAALPCMAAALLTEDTVILENIPQVRDIETTRKLLSAMNALCDERFREWFKRRLTVLAKLNQPYRGLLLGKLLGR